MAKGVTKKHTAAELQRKRDAHRQEQGKEKGGAEGKSRRLVAKQSYKCPICLSQVRLIQSSRNILVVLNCFVCPVAGSEVHENSLRQQTP